MDQLESWASYFYPETIDPLTGGGTLRNKLGERNARVLARREFVRTSIRAQQIESGAVTIPRTYDGAHLRAIHRHLFEDIYVWAGEYRTVNMFKGPGREFADVTTGELERYLKDVYRLVSSTGWARLDRNDFVTCSSTVFAYVNQAHPFREGNGRTSKIFIKHVADQSGFAFDYARVTPEEWNRGSALSGPDLFSYAPVPTSLIPVFDAITVERPEDGRRAHSGRRRRHPSRLRSHGG